MYKSIFFTAVVVVLLVGAGYYVLSKGGIASGDESENANKTLNTYSPVTSGDNPQPGSAVHDLPVEPAAAVARKDLAAKLSVENEKNIIIMRVAEETWSDGCLGLGGPAESCLAALTPGFRVDMEYAGQAYAYRTDKTGSTIRQEK